MNISNEIMGKMSPDELDEYKKLAKDLEEYTKIYESTWNRAWSSRSGVDFSTDLNKASQNQFDAKARLKNFEEQMVSKYTVKETKQEEVVVSETKVEKQADSTKYYSKEVHAKEIEYLVKSYVDYAIGKYRYDAIGYIQYFMAGNINGITRDRNFRARFEEYGITPQIVNYICGGNVVGYYNDKICSSLNIDYQQGGATR